MSTRRRALQGVTSVQTICVISAVVVGGVGAIGLLGAGFDTAIVGNGSGKAAASGAGVQIGTVMAAASDSTSIELGRSLVVPLGSSSVAGSSLTLAPTYNQPSGGSDILGPLSRLFANTQPQAIARSSTTSTRTTGLSARGATSFSSQHASLSRDSTDSANTVGARADSGEGDDLGGAFDHLSDQQLAARRGELYMQIQAQVEALAKAYANDNLSADELAKRIDELQDQLGVLDAENEQLREEQRRRAINAEGTFLTVLGAYLLEYAESPQTSTLLDRRFEDNRRLEELGRDREALVEKIKALKESGASVEQYQQLQAELAELDADIQKLLARDARRLESEAELGAEIILPKLEFKLESVGPDVSNEQAVYDFLKSTVSVTAEDLVAIMPNLPLEKAKEYEPLLNAAMERFEINTPKRQAAFIAQLAHESIGLTAFEELGSASYKARYGGYHGRGPIQLTWKGNYQAAESYFRDHFGVELGIVNNPARAADPEIGFQTAAWYWKVNGLNEYADQEAFEITSRLINCGDTTCRNNGGVPNGKSDRDRNWAIAKDILY